MIKWVQKRDGRIVPFRAEKIADAIFAAAKAVGGEDRRQAEVLAGQVIHLLQQKLVGQEVPQVEEIQDLVEKVLIEQGHARTAKAFILYRNQRTRIREAKSELMDAVSEIFQEGGSDPQVSTTPLGKLQRIAIAASERYSLHNLLPRDFSLAHQRGRIHIDRLAHYATAVTGVVLDLRPLLEQAQQIGRIRLPQLCKLEDLEQVIQTFIVAAQSETIGEIIVAHVDQVYATLCQRLGMDLSPTEVEHFACHLLTNINLSHMTGSAQPLHVGLSIGLAEAPQGRLLTQALLKALAQDTLAIAPLLTTQILYQLKDGVNLSPADTGYAATQLARKVAQQKGNPSFVYYATTDPEQVQFLASGTRLEMDSPVLISRTYINLPRLALSADSERDFLANVDAIFSLVAKQVVHRSEILTALQPADLPLTAWQLSVAQQKPLLSKALLLLVPIGIREALSVARRRFGFSLSIDEVDFFQLLNEICEHWRNYYSLNLQVGMVSAPAVARRFFTQDANSFPLVRSLWPQGLAYGDLWDEDMPLTFSGGHMALWPQSGPLREGIVYVVPIRKPVCLNCGRILEPGATSCPICPGGQLGELVQEGGYLRLREQLPAN